MNYETIIYQKEDGIGIITFNRPERFNAINEKFMKEMNLVLDEIEEDDEVRVVILTGGEKIFCSGADLKEAYTPATSKRLNRFFIRLEEFGKPTVAAINGYAGGGGCEIAVCCDLRVASETATFAFPEIKVGAMPSAGPTFWLPPLVGLGRAKELLYIGDPITAAEALNIGLVNRVVPAGTALDGAKNLAAVLLDRPPLSLRATKECIHAARGLDSKGASDFVRSASDLLRVTEDYQEGRTAFREKRKPVWKGR